MTNIMEIIMQHTLRLGAVSYLNTKPLVYNLQEYAPSAEIVFDLPSRLADRLSRGELDIALIPSIEYFQNSRYQIVSDACIGCRGPVWSVKLLSRKPMREIRTLALDEGSRTSAALTKILLDERFKISPDIRPLPIGDGVNDCDADAILLIGDRAIHPTPAQNNQPWVEIWDLGEEWRKWSGLPFVFAMWVARPGISLQGVSLKGMDDALSQARDAGMANLESIVEQEAPAANLSRDECMSYFRDNLYFYLGPKEREGLSLYYNHAAARGLAPEGVTLDNPSVQSSATEVTTG